MNGKLSPQNFKIIRPKGGFFVFMRISENSQFVTSDKYAAFLSKNYGVAVSPGIQFGSNWDNYVRITLSVPQETFMQGIELIENSVGR